MIGIPELSLTIISKRMPQEPLDGSFDFTELMWELFQCKHVDIKVVIIPFDRVEDFR